MSDLTLYTFKTKEKPEHFKENDKIEVFDPVNGRIRGTVHDIFDDAIICCYKVTVIVDEIIELHLDEIVKVLEKAND